MARYDVYPNPNADVAGYLLDVQTDLLDGLNTRIVVPLFPLAAAPEPADRLNPIFAIGGEDVVMATQYLAAVPLSMLTAPIGNMSELSTEITTALDMVFQGF